MSWDANAALWLAYETVLKTATNIKIDYEYWPLIGPWHLET